MKSQVQGRHRRRILCVFPRYAPSFGTFQYAYPLMGGVRAFMPPQGILVVAAYLPPAWEVRIIDENIRPTSEEEIAWAVAGSALLTEHRAARSAAAAIELGFSRRFIPPPPCGIRCRSRW